MANPGMISGGPGGRFSRGELSGDTRKFEAKKLNKGAILKRLWQYLGRNRLLLVLAIVFSVSSSVLALYGPKLSGKALDAVANGTDITLTTESGAKIPLSLELSDRQRKILAAGGLLNYTKGV